MATLVWGSSKWGAGQYLRQEHVRYIEVEVTREFSSGDPVWTSARSWTVAYGTTVTSMDRVLGNTVYAVRLRRRDVFGNTSAWSSTVLHRTVRDQTIPATPTGLTATSSGLGLHIEWDAIADTDLSYYKVRAAPVTAAAPVWATYEAKSNSFLLPAVTGPYYIQVKSVDTSGNESVWTD